MNIKSHTPADAKLLIGAVKELKAALRIGVLHLECERLKKTNATWSTTLAFVEDTIGYKI